MSSQFEDAAIAASSSVAARATIAGGLVTLTSGASHWLSWFNTTLSVLLGIGGLIAVIYGVLRQRQQRAAEVRREAREIEAFRLLNELHDLKVAYLRLGRLPDSDISPLGTHE